MDDITVLITGAGAPGIKGTLYSLENNFDGRKVVTVGTDMKEDVVGKYLCNRFYQIPPPSQEGYLTRLMSICKKENVDVLLPQNTAELSLLAAHRDVFMDAGTTVAISDSDAIDYANDKYRLMKVADKLKIPTTDYRLVDNAESLKEASRDLGWPEKPVVVKPPVSNGMRGLRIIDESRDMKKMFYTQKPTSVYTNMTSLVSVLGPTFPPLMVMEYLPGDEYTVDLLMADTLTVVPRKRDTIRSGITFNGTVERNEEIMEYSDRLSREIKLNYAYGFQFKLDVHGTPKLLECNPRIQGTMVLATLAGANVIYGAVKHALSEAVPAFDIKWGTRILRYWGGIGSYEGRAVGLI